MSEKQQKRDARMYRRLLEKRKRYNELDIEFEDAAEQFGEQSQEALAILARKNKAHTSMTAQRASVHHHMIRLRARGYPLEKQDIEWLDKRQEVRAAKERCRQEQQAAAQPISKPEAKQSFLALDTLNPEAVEDGHECMVMGLPVYRCDPDTLTMRIVGRMVECVKGPTRGVLWKFVSSDPAYRDSTYAGYGHSNLMWDLENGLLDAEQERKSG